jgi:Uma2 family endonuclease
MATILKPPAARRAATEEAGDNLLLRIPATAHTLPGFRAWVLSDAFPEKQPVMFFNGEVYLDMGKEDIFTHSAVKTAVAGTLFKLNEKVDFGDFFINGVLVTNVEANVSNNPDMAAVFWESLDSGRTRYVRNKKGRSIEIEGSLDWVLEIVSDSSVTKDTRDLRQAYHLAGIREYWLIDARGDDLKFHILHWRKTGYAAAPHKAGWQHSRVFARGFRFSRMRQRRGDLRYELAMSAE